MKIGLAVALAAVLLLGSWTLSIDAALRHQGEQIQGLTAALAARPQGQALALQTECAATATRFLASRGWKAGLGSSYENHFSAKLNKCFVLVSEYLPNDDFRTIDLYDAVEGKHYATYNGHNICSEIITKNPRKCAMDSGSIWSDGNDSRTPADITVGFRGLLYGGGAGDESTQKTFIDRVQAFMAQ